MSRFTLGVQATLVLPTSNELAGDPAALAAAGAGYGLQLAFAVGDGPTEFMLGPAPSQAPMSLADIVKQIAAMLKIDAIADVASLATSWPWSEVLAVRIAPFLTVAVGDAPAVQLVIKLYDKQGKYGIALGGSYGPITVEPNFTVYDLIVGYDKSKGGLDVHARVLFAEQPSAKLARLSRPLLGVADEPEGKTSVVSYPFPVPSQGTSNFKVEYFGLGQRFGPTVDMQAEDPLAAMFKELEHTFTTNDPKQLLDTMAKYYDPARDWFVAAHLQVRGWEIRAVFNDPVLYGLEVTCSVDQFKGLLLEILYQKLGPHLGVYYGALSMPEKFRQINLGAVALTLPSFKIWIYTNGDFKVSVGWPLGPNSIGVQVYIFTGGGGFYFGKLRSADQPGSGANALRLLGSDLVTDVIDYNPIIVFGLAMWFGVGRSISAGPFSASLSLTAQGTFQGILAWESAAGSSVSRTPDYFWFAATVGIVGQLQGEIDLSIVKLSVLIRLSVIAGVAFETGYGTMINITARVDAEARLKILFITISVGFHTTISTSFQISSGTPASLDGPLNPAFHGMNDWAALGVEHHAKRLQAHRAQLLMRAAPHSLSAPLPPAPQTPVQIALSFLLQPAAVYDGAAGTLAGVATLIIGAPAPSPTQDSTPTDLEQLSTALASWLLRTWSDGSGNWSTVVNKLGEGRASAPADWATLLQQFIGGELAFTLHPVDLTDAADADDSHWALFPMFDALQMVWTGQQTPLVFSQHARTYPDYPQVVEQYFAALSLNQLTSNPDARGSDRFGLLAAAGDVPQGPSLTAFIFADYFLLLSRQLARSLADQQTPQQAGGMPDTALAATLGGMTSRYLMNGMRIPDPATTPAELANVQLKQLDIAAGYGLSGQQFTVSPTGEPASITATLSLPASPDLQLAGAGIFFADGADHVTSTMPAETVPAAPAPVWTGPSPLDALAAANATITVARLPAMHSQALWFASRDRLPWTSSGVVKPFVAPLPTAVLTELTRQPLTLTVQATSPDSDQPATPLTVAPALMIRVPIHLVNQATSNNVAAGGAPITSFLTDIFSVQGADDETRDRIHSALGSGALAGATVSVLYDAATAGYQSDTLDMVKQPLVFAKTNLSTSSQPTLANQPLRLLRDRVGDAADPLGPTATIFPDPALPNDPASLARLETLLQLLWEVSVVHADGYYLRYANAAGQPLPVRIFTPPGQQQQGDIPAGDTAVLTLLVSFPASTRFERWHNAFTFTPVGELDGTLYLGVADAAGNPLQQYQPAYPAGCVGFEANWALEHLLSRESGKLFDSDWVNAMYHLIQFQVDGQAPSSPQKFDTSLWSVALSPTKDAVGGAQNYRQIVPAYRFIAGAGVDQNANPYAAVGGLPQLRFRVNDVFGNALEDATYVLDFPVLYNDPLLPPSEWPGVRAAYRYDGATLALSLHFDLSLVVRGTDPERTEQERQAALWTYASITAQLADPNVSVTMTQSVLPSNGGVIGDGAAIKAALAAFAGQAVEQVRGLASTATPFTKEIPIAINPADLANRGDDIFGISATLTMARPQQLVDPQALAGAPQTLSTAMTVAADLDPPATGTPRALLRAKASGEAPPDDVGLTLFATNFEATFKGFDGADGSARLAVRTAASDLSSPGASPSLWGMRLSTGKGVHVAIDGTKAVSYTLMPLSTKLMGGTIEVPTYTPDTLAPTSSERTFSGIDIDAWAQTCLSALDEVLSPATAVAIAAIDGEAYQSLMDAKALLAQALAKGVEKVFPSQTGGDLALAQDQFEQSVLAALSTAYAVSAVVQLPADVTVAGVAEAGDAAPRFFGKVGPVTTPADGAAGYTISGAKLPIVDSATQPGFLNFLVTASQAQNDAMLTLDLDYKARFVEHMLDSDASSYGYTASEWLRFVLDGDDDALNMPLGTISVPVPMRVFPASPVLQRHGAQQSPQANVADADSGLYWDYASTLVHTQQDAQDELRVKVNYNLPLTSGDQRLRAALGTIESVFEALGSFVTAWPVLQPYVDGLPTSVFKPSDDGPTPAEVIKALLEQVNGVANAWGALRGVTDRAGRLLFAAAPPPPPPPVSDNYVVNFAHAYDQGVLQVYAQAVNTVAGCDQDGIVWPTINQQPHGKIKPADAPPDDTACWYQSDYSYAPAPTAGAITIDWPQLDVTTRQTATSAYWIVRNANLSDGLKTNPALVYQTAVVAYPSPVVPFLTVPKRVYDSAATPAAAFENALQFFAQVTGAVGAQRLLKIAVSYRYQLVAPAGGLPALPAEISVLLAAGVALANEDGASDGSVTLQQLAQKLGDDVQTWYGIVQPSTTQAVLLLQILMFADVDGAQLPIVEATDIEITVPTGWWTPAAQ